MAHSICRADEDKTVASCVAPEGTFWVVGPASYSDTKARRTSVPKEFSSFEPVYTGGKCSYSGASGMET